MGNKAFTLVELIVVITIVGILSTVGFVSYTGYLSGARDSNRISQLTKLSYALQTYATSKSLPLPDNKINISLSGGTNVVAYQGEVGINVLETIDYTNGGLDPKDDSYYSYYVTKNREKLQLLTFLETESIQSLNSAFKPAYGNDYQDRFPMVYGSKLGILLSGEENTINTPINQLISVGSLDIFASPDLIRPYFSNEDNVASYSGYTLGAFLSTRMGGPRPGDCPIGFVGVRGNIEYSTEGFCVAQYEMSYSDADTPNSLATGNRNTVLYEEGKIPVSMPGKYPISTIDTIQAREACKSMGKGFRLITNDQWMTVARNIETNPVNWTSGVIGQGGLYNGVSSDPNFGCTGGALGGNTEPRDQVVRTGPGDSDDCNSKRAQKLNNGAEVWDLAGNVFEKIDKGEGYESFFSLPTATTDVGNWDGDGIYHLSDMRRVGSLFGLGVSGGMGSVNFPMGRENNAFQRGGFANSGELGGLYTLFLGFYEDNTGDALGFRCTRDF